MLAFANYPYSQSQAEVDGNGSVLVTNQSFGQTDLMMALDEESLQLINGNMTVSPRFHVETFATNINLMAALDKKSSPKSLGLHPSCDVCTKYHGNLSSSCWDISVCGGATGWQTSHTPVWHQKQTKKSYDASTVQMAKFHFDHIFSYSFLEHPGQPSNFSRRNHETKK